MRDLNSGRSFQREEGGPQTPQSGPSPRVPPPPAAPALTPSFSLSHLPTPPLLCPVLSPLLPVHVLL